MADIRRLHLEAELGYIRTRTLYRGDVDIDGVNAAAQVAGACIAILVPSATVVSLLAASIVEDSGRWARWCPSRMAIEFPNGSCAFFYGEEMDTVLEHLRGRRFTSIARVMTGMAVVTSNHFNVEARRV